MANLYFPGFLTLDARKIKKKTTTDVSPTLDSVLRTRGKPNRFFLCVAFLQSVYYLYSQVSGAWWTAVVVKEDEEEGGGGVKEKCMCRRDHALVEDSLVGLASSSHSKPRCGLLAFYSGLACMLPTAHITHY